MNFILISIINRAKHKLYIYDIFIIYLDTQIYHSKQCVLTHPFSFNYHLVTSFSKLYSKIFVMVHKMCIITNG